MVSTVVLGILGVLTALIEEFAQPPYRPWMVAGMILTTVLSALFQHLNERDDKKAAEVTERLVLGRGGYPLVMVRGFLPIPEQTMKGRVLAEVIIMNRSDVPVVDSRVTVMHLVGIPHGFNGTDSNIYNDIPVPSVNPHDAPHTLFSAPLLKTDEPNIFTAIVFSKWAAFTQYIVVVWKDGAWHTDTGITQHADKQRGNEKKLLRPMRPELRSLLPDVWQAEVTAPDEVVR
jgi:hypothetical protein